MHGPIASEKILPSRRTLSKQIETNATEGRAIMKSILLDAARERSLALSPDIWSDAHRQQSYLGCTAHWISHEWTLHSLEIFCVPFNTPNKRAVNVMKVRNSNKFHSIQFFFSIFLKGFDGRIVNV